ncbi:M28 family metallopeptidase [Novosphingobium sp. Chol11]|uniref:M28 family metallopeptidase n=1 Tax=Novosphingobium sp. Chol11 TaxID=1385763 RepID=UPI0025E87E7B|nr:M28 family metallopeptidase [Novosphingobium sp. Chol11]
MFRPAVLLAIAFSSPVAAQTWQPEEAAMRGHVGFLASDEMNGREAGTREFDIAARYVAAQFETMGLKPAGAAGGYLQPVPLVTFRPADKGSISLIRGTSETALEFGTDYLPGASPQAAEMTKDAALVFAGFGVVAPTFKRDDYAGLDVKGKIVVLLAGAPSALPTEERAHYSNGATKREQAAKRGAVGILLVDTPTREKVSSFARRARNWRNLGATWAQADGAPYYPGGTAPILAQLSLAGAAKLFAGLPGGSDAVMAAAESKAGNPKRMALPMTVRAALKTEINRAMSANVAGVIEGSDPALKDEVVVLSAHLDHVGTCPEVKGDTLCNGAMDNAMGVASMIEVAHGFKHLKARPKRSVLFLAVTAEEKGLVGADYFAQNPTFPKGNLVANVNLDMPLITYDFKDVVAFGAERSSIGPAVARAGATLGIALVPDPQPEQGLFTRSDHYRFVQQGIPAVFLVTGPGGEGAAAMAAFLETHYHQPSDDMKLPFKWGAAARFVALNLAIARELADMPARPSWNKGDFFGTLYGGYGATGK